MCKDSLAQFEAALALQTNKAILQRAYVDINRIQAGKVVKAWHIGSPEAILQALGYQLTPPTE